MAAKINAFIAACSALIVCFLVIFALWHSEIHEFLSHEPFSGFPNALEDPISDVTWSQLDSTFRMIRDQTALQQSEKWREFDHRRVQWTGRVVSVDEIWGLHMRMDMAGTTSEQLRDWSGLESLNPAVEVRLLDSEKDNAMQLKVGQMATIVGVLLVGSEGYYAPSVRIGVAKIVPGQN